MRASPKSAARMREGCRHLGTWRHVGSNARPIAAPSGSSNGTAWAVKKYHEEALDEGGDRAGTRHPVRHSHEDPLGTPTRTTRAGMAAGLP